jgi:hypothetical protein
MKNCCLQQSKNSKRQLFTDSTTSHLTKLQKTQQVIGYDKTTSHPIKQPQDGCQVAGYKAEVRNGRQ